jgi:carboxypeptidase PM20D1
MTIIKKGLLGLVAVIFILATIVIVRTLAFTPEPIASVAKTMSVNPDSNLIAEHLSQAIQIPTISNDNAALRDKAAFRQFKVWLATTYPEVHEQLSLTYINDYTLLFKWSGKTPSKPSVLFSAHYDVVPINPGTESQWQHPPFAGVIDNGIIWGRGALDDKSAVVALMESVTLLVKDTFIPEQDTYIALTHDEEIGSKEGAQAVTAYFKEHNISLAWSLDEGSFVLDGLVPGSNKRVASINVAEKGLLTIELIAKGVGGHSSMPPQDTAVSILAEAIVKVKNAPVPGGLEGLGEQMYKNIAKHMDFSKRMLFANTWLFKPLIEASLASSPAGNAMLRTTTAPTMLSGSVKSNVLPATATATINFRIHPRDTIDSVISWVETTINDPRISIKTIQASLPSTISDSENQGFKNIAAVTSEVHGDVIITPGLTLAATDSRFYSEITDSYRFNPMNLTPEYLSGFHGTNERIEVKSMVDAVNFYTRLMAQTNE